jgi:tetratricopeptide (TPR) repeat protein
LGLQGSYEDLYSRALEAVDPANPDEAIAQFRRLFDRLSGLSPELRAKGAGLNQVMISAGDRLADLLRWKGDFADSQEVLDRLETLAPELKDEVDVERAFILIDSGKVEQGLDLLRGQVMQRPRSGSVRLVLGQELFAAGQLQEAERTLKRIAQDKTTREVALQANQLLVEVYLAMGDLHNAQAALNRAAAIDANARDRISSIYDWLLHKKDYAALEEMLKEDGVPMRAGLYLGRIAAAQGDLEEAKKRWTRAADKQPEKTWASLFAFTEVLMHLGRNEDALSILATAMSEGVADLTSLVASAIALTLTGHVDRAAQGIATTAASMVQFRPRKTVLPEEYWWLVEQYVTDEGQRAILRRYFDVPQEERQPQPNADAGRETPIPA